MIELKGYAHALFAIAFLSFTSLWMDNRIALFIFIAVSSSLIPDLDLKHGHRKALHNVFIPMLLAFIFYWLLPYLDVNRVFVVPFLIGWLSHLLLDTLTIKGVYLFYPILDVGISFKICRSSSVFCNTLIVMLSLIIILYNSNLLL